MLTFAAPEVLLSAHQYVIAMILQASWFRLALLAVASVVQLATTQGATWLLLQVHTKAALPSMLLNCLHLPLFPLAVHSGTLYCISSALHLCLAALTKTITATQLILVRLCRPFLQSKQQRPGHLAEICQGHHEPERGAEESQSDGLGGRRQLLQLGGRDLR